MKNEEKLNIYKEAWLFRVFLRECEHECKYNIAIPSVDELADEFKKTKRNYKLLQKVKTKYYFILVDSWRFRQFKKNDIMEIIDARTPIERSRNCE